MSKYSRPHDVPQPSQGSWRYLPLVQVFGDSNELGLQAAINQWLTAQISEPFTVYIHDVKFSTTGAGGSLEYSALVHYTVTQAD